MIRYANLVSAIEGLNDRSHADDAMFYYENAKDFFAALREARNELCLKCGRYKDAHNGACNGCKWEA